MLYPQHDGVSQDYQDLSAKVRLAGSVSVARVRPRTSLPILRNRSMTANTVPS